VYLGLVLVGATPQVLAQAAMTRQFNVKDEVEISDDVDDNPTPTSEQSDQAFGAYFDGIVHFLADLEKVWRRNDGELANSGFGTRRVSHSPCNSTDLNVFREFNSPFDKRFVDPLSRAKLAATVDLSYLSDCLPYLEIPDSTKARKLGVQITCNKKDLRYQVSLDFGSPEKTRHVLEVLQDRLEALRATDTAEDQIQAVLYRHTQLTSVDTQIFIVTRLPRAGLDPLLAIDAQ
jgi:hypothetical protein